MENSELLDIGEVAAATGLPPSTLRYYEEKGLIISQGRRGLRRTYLPSIIERLSLISLGRLAGFTLEELAGMLSGKPSKIDRSFLVAKADELDRKIAQLQAMSKGLRHAAVCDAPSHLECPTFQRLLKLSTEQNKKRRRSNRD